MPIRHDDEASVFDADSAPGGSRKGSIGIGA
jgi:hypothetical protein